MATWAQPSRVNKLEWMPRNAAVAPRPFDGSSLRSTANSRMRISPTQKVGRLKPRIEPAMIALPLNPWGLSPAHRPSGMPTTTVRSNATSASSKVAGRRVEHERAAEIAQHGVVQEGPILLPHRLVEAERGGGTLDLLLGRLGRD